MILHLIIWFGRGQHDVVNEKTHLMASKFGKILFTHIIIEKISFLILGNPNFSLKPLPTKDLRSNTTSIYIHGFSNAKTTLCFILCVLHGTLYIKLKLNSFIKYSVVVFLIEIILHKNLYFLPTFSNLHFVLH